MINILILFELCGGILTMYGISKEISKHFGVLTTPSFGTIKPALKKMVDEGLIKTQKTMSEGGRPAVYYSITNEGKMTLKSMILEDPVENPVQFLTTSRVKVASASVLNDDEQAYLYKQLLLKANTIIADTKNILSERKYDYFRGIVLDNLLCEYKNFASMLEGLNNARNN